MVALIYSNEVRFLKKRDCKLDLGYNEPKVISLEMDQGMLADW